MLYCEVLSKRCVDGKSEYTLKTEDGKNVRMSSVDLKKSVRAGAIDLLNMRLTSDDKLILFNYEDNIDKVKNIIEKKARVHLRQHKCRHELEWTGNNHTGFTLTMKIYPVESHKTYLNPALVTFTLRGAEHIQLLGRKGEIHTTSISKVKTDKGVSALLAVNVDNAIESLVNVDRRILI